MSGVVRSVRSVDADPYDRGRELGRRCGVAVREAWARYTELWAAYTLTPEEVRAVGADVLGPVEAFAPTLHAEMTGIAAGAGLDDWQVGALNARTELLAIGDQRLVASGLLPGGHGSECSTLVSLPSTGQPVAAQTWDWHTPLSESWFVWSLGLADGRTVRTLTEYGIVGKIGVAAETDRAGNSRGLLAVNFNALRHRADSGRGGVPVHSVARRILDQARTIGDAIDIAGAADVSASAAVTVTAPDGEHGSWAACTLELHPGGPSVLRQSEGEGHSWLAHTNHFLSAEIPDDDQAGSEVSTSPQRLDRVDRLVRSTALDASDGPQPVAEQLATHDLGPRSVCVHGFPDAPVGQRAATLAVAVAEPAAGRLHVHAGKPCEARASGWWSG